MNQIDELLKEIPIQPRKLEVAQAKPRGKEEVLWLRHKNNVDQLPGDWKIVFDKAKKFYPDLIKKKRHGKKMCLSIPVFFEPASPYETFLELRDSTDKGLTHITYITFNNILGKAYVRDMYGQFFIPIDKQR